MKTNHGSPRLPLLYGLILAIITISVLGILESRHSIDEPKHLQAPSAARTHLSVAPAKKVSRRPIPAIGTQENPDTGLEPHGTTIPDPRRKGPGFATASEAKLEAWIDGNLEVWDSADEELQDCVAYSYLNGWSWTPDDALSYCNTNFELGEGD